MKAHSPARRGPRPNPETRSNLIKAGLAMLHAEGYAATGIQSVVEAVNMPKGSFYNHFSSKEAFGAEILDAYFARNEPQLRAFFEDPTVEPLAQLKAYFDDRIEAFRAMGLAKGCLLGNFSAEVVDHSELLRERVATHFESWCGFLERCIAEAQAQGTIGRDLSAAVLSRFILNSWEGALLRMRAERSDRPLLDFRSIVFDKLLT